MDKEEYQQAINNLAISTGMTPDDVENILINSLNNLISGARFAMDMRLK